MSFSRSTISYRDDGPLATLKAIRASDGQDSSFSRAVTQVVGQYVDLISASLPRLSRAEWTALAGAHWNHIFTHFDYRASSALSVNLQDSSRSELVDWGIDDPAALIERIKNFSVAERYSVIEAVRLLNRSADLNQAIEVLCQEPRPRDFSLWSDLLKLGPLEGVEVL